MKFKELVKRYSVDEENKWLPIPYPEGYNRAFIQIFYDTNPILRGHVNLQTNLKNFSFVPIPNNGGSIGIYFIFFKL